MSELRSVLRSFGQWDVAAALAFQDIGDRFKRTVIGPFWIVISNAALVAGITVVFGALFKADIADFVVYVALGIALWTFMSATITQASKYFESAKQLLFTFDLPWILQVVRKVLVEAIVLGIHLLVAIPVILWTQPGLGPVTLMALFGLVLVIIFGFGTGLIIASYGARYSDLSHALDSLMLFLFLFTPVFWTVEALGPARSAFATYNPLYHMLEVVRGPVLDQTVPWTSFGVAAGLAITTLAIGLYVYIQRRAQLAMWIG